MRSPLSTKAQDCEYLANAVVSKTLNSSLKLPDLDECIAQRRENLYASKSKASKFIRHREINPTQKKRKSKTGRKSNPDPFLVTKMRRKKGKNWKKTPKNEKMMKKK